jgi:hypothetical protein
MGLKGYRLWVMGKLDSTCRAPTRYGPCTSNQSDTTDTRGGEHPYAEAAADGIEAAGAAAAARVDAVVASLPLAVAETPHVDTATAFTAKTPRADTSVLATKSDVVGLCKLNPNDP